MTTKRAVFIDTAGWIALIHRGDVLHQQATRIYKSFGKIRRVTTDAVIIETFDVLPMTKDRGFKPHDSIP